MTALVLNPGRKRRRARKSGKRWTPAARRAFAVKMAKYRKGGRKKSRRLLAANDWPGHSAEHAYAAVAGWGGRGITAKTHPSRWKSKKHRKASRKGKLHGKAKAAFLRRMSKGRRRTRSGRRGRFGFSPRRARRSASIAAFFFGKKKRRGGRRHRNPAATLRLPGGKLTAGFKPSAIIGLAPVAGGAFANLWLTPKVAGFLPAGWATGWKKSVVGLGSAGVIAAVTGMVAPKFAARATTGAVVQTVLELANNLLSGAAVAARPVPPAAVPAAAPAAARTAGMGGTWAPEFEGDPASLAGIEYLGADLEETFS